MASPFLAEIRIFGFNFAPRGWATCAGQILPIQQNTALFALIGTFYGGNGINTFALPMGQGQGPGLSPYSVGQTGGSQTVTLLSNQMPAHNHGAGCYNNNGDSYSGSNAIPAVDAGGNNLYSTPSDSSMNPAQLTPAGGGQPHNNMQSYLTLTYCIALQGIFPARN